MGFNLTYNLNSNTFKGSFLAGTSYLSLKMTEIRLRSLTLLSYRVREARGVIFKLPVRKPMPGFAVLFQTCHLLGSAGLG